MIGDDKFNKMLLEKHLYIEIINKEHIDLISSKIDFSLIPPKSKGRRSYHIENYSMLKYLIILHKECKLEFPFTLKKAHQESEPPDFIIDYYNYKVGIEVTTATHEEYQMAETQLEKEPEGTFLELSDFKPGIKKGNSFHWIKTPGQSITGSGWQGYEAEDDWKKFIQLALEKKLSVLNDPQRNWFPTDFIKLLIYDNTPSGWIDYKNIADELKNITEFLFAQHPKIFDEVIIFRNWDMIIITK